MPVISLNACLAEGLAPDGRAWAISTYYLGVSLMSGFGQHGKEKSQQDIQISA